MSNLTRRDYIVLAAAIRQALSDCAPISELEQRVATRIIGGILNVLKADNPRFDRDRFIEACGKGAKP